MNAKDFVAYVNQHLPPALGKVTAEHLKRWEELGILRPHPEYTKDDVHPVSGLLQIGRPPPKGSRSGGLGEEPGAPRLGAGPIYQVLSILGQDTSQGEVPEAALIRLALIKSGLISALGLTFINHSPLTGQTLESMLQVPEYKSRFEAAESSKEFLVIREAQEFVEERTGGERFTSLSPILFFQGAKPTIVYSSFIFGGQGRLLGPGHYEPLRRPLYHEFLDVEVCSLDDILRFMAAHTMIGSFGVPPSEDAIEFIRTTQSKMRAVLTKAAKGSLSAADLSPLTPFHEDDHAQATMLAEMGGLDIFTPEGKPASVDEIKIAPAYAWKGGEWAPYDKNMLPIKRYYSWLDYMWADLIDAAAQGNQTPVCLRCGKLLEPKRGKRRTYCGRENPTCFRARQAAYVRESRDRGKLP